MAVHRRIIEALAMPTLLIIGASRGIGLETVRAALGAGYKVRALSRSANAITLDDPFFEKIAGDALNRQTIKCALAGADAVIQGLGVRLGRETVLKGTTLFSQATRVLVDEMQYTGLKRLVVVTGLGAGDSQGTDHSAYVSRLPAGLAAHLRRQERAGRDNSVEQSRLDHRSPGNLDEWACDRPLSRSDRR